MVRLYVMTFPVAETHMRVADVSVEMISVMSPLAVDRSNNPPDGIIASTSMVPLA